MICCCAYLKKMIDCLQGSMLCYLKYFRQKIGRKIGYLNSNYNHLKYEYILSYILSNNWQQCRRSVT
jgi:hypothetical protein